MEFRCLVICVCGLEGVLDKLVRLINFMGCFMGVHGRDLVVATISRKLNNSKVVHIDA